MHAQRIATSQGENLIYIIIIGCGRLGSLLATELSSAGDEVVVIDRDASEFDKLSVDFSGYTIAGDAVEKAVLREAGIAEADALFAVTSQDNINLMVAQIASRIFDVETVIARIDDPDREAIYREFGIRTVSQTHLAAQAFIQTIKKADDA
ncbi:MAG: TrkA family potassium uptake protein [Chloroflexota bacterium]